MRSFKRIGATIREVKATSNSAMPSYTPVMGAAIGGAAAIILASSAGAHFLLFDID